MSRDLVLNDRYRLVERLATGGMGEVWRAADQALAREVAVKLLRRELMSDAAACGRFRSEARFAAGLRHSGIAQVYDAGTQDGRAYLVLELVQGEPLSEIIVRAGALPPEAVLDLIAQAGRALAAAHAGGIVHRDVKPANLMVTGDGIVKITDFGIARRPAEASQTQTGMVMGTAYYISPEQASGQEVTPSADLYSLGAVAYECLTGRVPFEGETPVAVALKHVRDAPPPLSSGIPAPVRGLVAELLAKRPFERPADADETADRALVIRDSSGLSRSGLSRWTSRSSATGEPWPDRPSHAGGTGRVGQAGGTGQASGTGRMDRAGNGERTAKGSRTGKSARTGKGDQAGRTYPSDHTGLMPNPVRWGSEESPGRGGPGRGGPVRSEPERSEPERGGPIRDEPGRDRPGGLGSGLAAVPARRPLETPLATRQGLDEPWPGMPRMSDRRPAPAGMSGTPGRKARPYPATASGDPRRPVGAPQEFDGNDRPDTLTRGDGTARRRAALTYTSVAAGALLLGVIVVGTMWRGLGTSEPLRENQERLPAVQPGEGDPARHVPADPATRLHERRGQEATPAPTRDRRESTPRYPRASPSQKPTRKPPRATSSAPDPTPRPTDGTTTPSTPSPSPAPTRSGELGSEDKV